MFALRFSRWLQQRGWHYSWVIVTVTFLTALTSSAAFGLPGALLQPLSREFGWDVEQISSALAIRFVLFGLMGPFAAILMERFGPRAVVVTALSLVAGVLTASSATGQLIFLPVGAWLIEHFGWRLAVLPVFVACALLVWAFMRNRLKPA